MVNNAMVDIDITIKTNAKRSTLTFFSIVDV